MQINEWFSNERKLLSVLVNEIFLNAIGWNKNPTFKTFTQIFLSWAYQSILPVNRWSI